MTSKKTFFNLKCVAKIAEYDIASKQKVTKGYPAAIHADRLQRWQLFFVVYKSVTLFKIV
jgi:hypothetical protein